MKFRRSPRGPAGRASSLPPLRAPRPPSAASNTYTGQPDEQYAVLLQGLSDLGEGVTMVVASRFVYVNDAFCQISGYARDELLALETVAALAPANLTEQARQRLARLRENAEIGRFRGALRHKAGHTVDLEVSTKLVQHHGRPMHLSVMRDVSTRAQAEHALAQANALVQLLQAIAIACNEAMSLDAALAATLRDICTYTGWPVGQVYLTNRAGELEATAIWHTDDPNRYAAFRHRSDHTRIAPGVGVFGHVFAHGRPAWIVDLAQEHEFLRRAEAAACGLVSAFALPILLGREIVGVIEFFNTVRTEPDAGLVDLLIQVGRQIGRVVERQRAEEELRHERDNSAALLHVLSDLGEAVVVGEGERIISVNDAFCALTGYSGEELCALPSVAAITTPEALPLMRDIIERVSRGESIGRAESELCHKDGRIIPIELGSQLGVFDGKSRRIMVFRDISEHVREQEALRQLTTKLAHSNRELQDFAYIASHDLQEPLRKIRAFGDRLVTKYATTLGPDGQDYVQRMQNASARLQALIDDLLTFAQIETKPEPFRLVDLAQIAHEVVSNLEARIADTGGHVTLGRLPKIEANPVQMYQLLQNLIGNALKFARTGVAPSVTVSARSIQAERRGQPAIFELLVADNGIGFDEKYIDRIFTPFQRLHSRGQFEGTGMGLAICRRIVEQHHGTITATSVAGQGSTFIIHLPATH